MLLGQLFVLPYFILFTPQKSSFVFSTDLCQMSHIIVATMWLVTLARDLTQSTHLSHYCVTNDKTQFAYKMIVMGAGRPAPILQRGLLPLYIWLVSPWPWLGRLRARRFFFRVRSMWQRFLCWLAFHETGQEWIARR